MSNYRSISILTTFFKVFEKVMHDRLSHYFQTNNILVPDSVLKSVNQKMHVGGKFCVLAKVFDYVNQDILLTKLHFLLAFKVQHQVGSDLT
jgi:hypothetical protein